MINHKEHRQAKAGWLLNISLAFDMMILKAGSEVTVNRKWHISKTVGFW
jgi:hypothetical protein